MSTPTSRPLLVALSALAITAGCSGAPAPTDAGGIRLADGGAPDVPFVEPDAGDGTCGDATSPVGWRPLPATCLPRCTAATRAATEACLTAPDPAGCTNSVTAADPTPVAHVRWGDRILDVACNGTDTIYSCVVWQAFSCEYELCPMGYETYIQCIGAGGTCEAEFEAMDACAHANPGWDSCLGERASACYGTEP